MSVSPVLQLGTSRAPDGSHPGVLRLPAHHLVTHGCVLGMTGSGKTGLLTVLLEEALRGGVPVLMIDVKRDLPNLLLPFADFAGARSSPGSTSARTTRVADRSSPSARRASAASIWRAGRSRSRSSRRTARPRRFG